MYGSRKGDQYKASPMDGSKKDGQTRVPATATVAKGPLAPAAMRTRVLGMAPMAGAAPKGPVAPAVGPVRALAPVVEKVRAAGGWWHAAAVAPVAVPVGHLRRAHKR
jgi:hypothetical protein